MEGLDLELGAVNFEVTIGPLRDHEWAISCSSLECRGEVSWDSLGSP